MTKLSILNDNSVINYGRNSRTHSNYSSYYTMHEGTVSSFCIQ